MKYNEVQIEAVIKMMRDKHVSGDVESHEIAVALTAAVTAGRLSAYEMKYVLCSVFYNNVAGVIHALKRAGQIIDGQMIANIINEVESARP
ncbi:hypothetical protein [Paenibacillus agricola]|uniref:Anthranilate phosphoribosyltransferase n=1 Tax=Paenibacillus agricola TaxID=2716264 RepID=A0ABX0J180_9BACL|nr:hypothetical protein [Paenibacillus agricola]NHN28543.1 hypothetical protein [Paenibacillus agricola]